MKNLTLRILLASSFFGGQIPMVHSLLAESTFHCDGKLTKQFKNVFDHLGVSVSTLAEANEFAQKNLLRTGERWDAQAETDLSKIMRKNKELLLSDLKELGMIDAVVPKEKSYRYALLMGSLKSTVSFRINYLLELEKEGFSFKEIVLLGGARQLRDDEKEGLPSTVTTEAEMMKYLCESNPELKNKKILLVDAPMIQKADGTFTRPTTDSTLVHFAKIAPESGSCLVISNNPYVIRQTKVAQRILDQSRFPTDGAGKAAKEDATDIVILMDELARTIYEEFKQLNSNK